MSLVHAEYLKVTRRKLYPGMLLILAVLIGVVAFFLMVFAQVVPEAARDVPVLEKPGAYLIGAQQVASQTWFPLILAVVVLGGEMGSTVWATSLTRDSRKTRHILARLLVFTLASWLAFLIGTGIWSGIAALAAEGSGAPEIGEWVGVVWRMGLIALAWTSLGLGAISVLRSLGPAIGAVLAFSFGESILALWGPYENVSLSAATSGLFRTAMEGFVGVFLPGVGMSVAQSIGIILGWTLFGLILTWWGVQRRDA
jgi:hypothetical protein